MSRTSVKLGEARFFLKQMEGAVAQHPEFDYFLSAFVSSARSVTWVLRAEYKDHAGWLDWYNGRKASTAEAQLLGQMNTLRVRSEKFDPLVTKAAVVMNIPPESVTPELEEFLATGVGRRFRTWIYEAAAEGGPLPTGVPEGATVFFGTFEGFERHLPELNDRDVMSACAAYLASLESLVSEAEAAANAA